MAGERTFVGFGFGPIQSGLFLYEAHASGNFSRFVVAEVDDAVVKAVNANDGRVFVNIARKSGVDTARISGIEMYNPRDAASCAMLVEAVAASSEIATALPSVAFYDRGDDSPAAIIAEGLASRRAARATAVYAAENHNHAAEILAAAVAARTGSGKPASAEFLNTVIGKMSGTISDPSLLRRMNLATLTPGLPRAVLVEEFNRILISRIHLAGFRRGIEAFVEKEDLLPFEEAKLYGHNAAHAVIAYLADLKAYETIADAGRDGWIMSVARAAFVDESGGALVRRHAGLGDHLFTPAGYREYAEDLLDRMTRPTLNDLVARVGRDHERKLGYGDRLFGTMRIALENGIEPVNLALGAAACLLSFVKRRREAPRPPKALPTGADGLTPDSLRVLLQEVWGNAADERSDALVELTARASLELRRVIS